MAVEKLRKRQIKGFASNEILSLTREILVNGNHSIDMIGSEEFLSCTTDILVLIMITKTVPVECGMCFPEIFQQRS